MDSQEFMSAEMAYLLTIPNHTYFSRRDLAKEVASGGAA
jgi:hypothetical protein